MGASGVLPPLVRLHAFRAQPSSRWAGRRTRSARGERASARPL